MSLHDQWYKNAIFYCLDVETFADSNGDGVGDFPGLTRRLDYLEGLGVNCVWLLPFYPSPGRDDGYDITDYFAVDPRYGTLGDFTEFMVEARERGIHVIVDLVPNHTSNEHPWFQAARRDPDSPYRDYYVWRHDDPGDTSDKVVFPGHQKSIWTFDETAGAWYLHHFYDFEPDLNFTNPAVRDEFRKIMGLWLQLGVDGFRIDAAPFIDSLADVAPGQHLGNTHEFLDDLRGFAAVRSGNAILLGEVDVSVSTIADYFGGGNELQALFNFPLSRYLFLALLQRSADPIQFAFKQLPTIPETGQWVNFLRNHDELNLSRLTRVQRESLEEAFAPDATMRIYERGIRRRLAPMLGNDQAWIRLAYSLLFGLPGAPLLFYGEEIGMAENLALPERLSVRTPMQWTPYDNGGFSTAPPEQLVRPMVDGDYGFPQVSVGAERGRPDSLLNWMAALMRVRRECGEIGDGTCSMLDTGEDAVLGLRFDVPDSTVVVYNNLSPERRTVAVDLCDEEIATATDLFTDRPYRPLEPGTRRFRLDGLGYRWMRLRGIY
ncbi:MAG TPA: alpha-amylase family protein [Thermomicrobiaceae bacterium]|nr:alpha-amylase family protein [Thermomicrobiaceae bacterium]